MVEKPAAAVTSDVHEMMEARERTGRFVAVGFAEGPVRVYGTSDWSQTGYFALGERASSLALAPDERMLAVGLRNGRLVLCDLSTNQQRSLRSDPRLSCQQVRSRQIECHRD